MTLTALGIVVGPAGALAATRVMQTLLFGIDATDPLTPGGVAAFLGLVALTATCVPARRATRVDPAMAPRTG